MFVYIYNRLAARQASASTFRSHTRTITSSMHTPESTPDDPFWNPATISSPFSPAKHTYRVTLTHTLFLRTHAHVLCFSLSLFSSLSLSLSLSLSPLPSLNLSQSLFLSLFLFLHTYPSFEAHPPSFLTLLYTLSI